MEVHSTAFDLFCISIAGSEDRNSVRSELESRYALRIEAISLFLDFPGKELSQDISYSGRERERERES